MGLDQRRRREGTRSGQERLRSIVERLPDGIVIVGGDDTVRFCNPAAADLFGQPAKELLGSPFGLPVITGDSGEVDLLRPGGATVTAELRLVETEWEGERVRLVTLRNVTDRKRAADRAFQLERERHARAEAEAASQTKSEFLATMSHELRTPLNAVIGYSDILDLGLSGELTAEQRRHVERIRESARHLLSLVNEILDLAKVEAGRLTVQNQAVTARDTIDAAFALVQPIAASKGITLANDCTEERVVFEGDPERVRQIVLNLLNNGVKFTQPGGQVRVACALEIRPDIGGKAGSAGWVSIAVSDTGIGIPKDKLSAIFDPFVQVDGGHKRQNDGTGLGLTISRRLARLMGGDLVARSEVGKGSTFTLWLREASAAQREAAQWRARAPDMAARIHGLAEVGTLLIRDLGAIVESFVVRLRDEAVVPGADTLRTSQLADHAAAFVADIASMLAAVEEARGEPSRLVKDIAHIQNHIADQHGEQRARLGWSVDALRREWVILREELERVIRRGAKIVPEGAVPEAMLLIERMVEQARERSTAALLKQSDSP
jgi:signal transduction histidine kinase